MRSDTDINLPTGAELRKRAEDLLGSQTTQCGVPQVEDDTRQLLRELLAHQIQLEEQNDALQNRRAVKLYHPHSLLDAICEGSTDAIYVKDFQGRYQLFNHETEKILGKNSRDVIGKDDHFLFPDSEAETIMTGDRLLMEHGQVRTYEEVVTTVNGIRTYLSTKGPIRDENGTITGVFGVSRDITERKQAEEAIHQYTWQLIEMEEVLRKQIVAELHDNIGQDLTALSLNLSYIGNNLEKASEIQLRSRLNDSRQLTKEINRTVRNLMATLRPPQLDEYGLAATVLWQAELVSSRNDFDINVYVDPEFPRLSQTMEMELFRIIQEALNNVSKHANATIVDIFLAHDETRVSISISDDGRGFADVSPQCRTIHSGWGLTIMQERAGLIGGFFSIESSPGCGTNITIEIMRDNL